ncbi:MAG: NAD(P)-dependent oxidoreductase [Alphaproteobacteria bacterium]|nr:MAG: NAD(P)-dependent oxidoreductase [Alphaproteobacteria bacterium]
MAHSVCRQASGGPLSSDEIAANFGDLHTPLTALSAMKAADHCLYCYDAPCIQACPTGIDIPTFIHQIRSGNIAGSARTILSQNIMGGTCARACPTEVLCEQACVRNAGEGDPVEIGLLQRYAVDHLMAKGGKHPFERAADSGKRVAIVGAGPAGLSCAHRLAMLGHTVTVFEAKGKPGGLNEYGLAAYKMTDEFAAREVDFISAIGGIEIKYHQRLGDNLALNELRDTFDAVFIGVGLGATNSLGLDGEGKEGVLDAIRFIEDVRQAADKATVAVGKAVVVIGGGNTAIDAAVQAKCLGAGDVTLVYRRGEDAMSATPWEVDLARQNGVAVRTWAKPVAIEGGTAVRAMTFERTRLEDGKLVGTGETFTVAADMVLKAIGQKLVAPDGLATERGKLVTDDSFMTSLKGVFAGGDCVKSGEDLTVQAVADGRDAAHAIDAYLKGGDQ